MDGQKRDTSMGSQRKQPGWQEKHKKCGTWKPKAGDCQEDNKSVSHATQIFMSIKGTNGFNNRKIIVNLEFQWSVKFQKQSISE